MKLNITISIDDVHPQGGWRIIGDKTEKWLESLNGDFGAKFTLFIPSNYHGQYPISGYKSWIDELVTAGYYELAAHGHFHMTSDQRRFGECEFYELTSADDIVDRFNLMFNEWNAVEISPIGWRSPGWLMHRQVLSIISMQTDYAALHYEHNKDLKPGRLDYKIFFGHDGINKENITLHNGNMIMFQSHISGDWNDNVWNEQNYHQLRLSLEYLTKNYDCEFKTLKECI